MKRLSITLAGLLAAASALAQTNVALTGTATQSSTGYDGPAHLAIDGNTDGVHWLGSVSHTQYDAQAWWQVALAADAAVAQVVVWNRTDCCAERLSDYTVSLWNDGALVASQFFAGTSPVSHGFTFGDLVADTVRVQLSGTNHLSLAEVQVFAAAPVPEPAAWLTMAGGLALLLQRRKARAASATSAGPR